ncbi:MAG: hypothetical protein ACRC6U_08410 [Fusobacteriaceae bacterium]
MFKKIIEKEILNQEDESLNSPNFTIIFKKLVALIVFLAISVSAGYNYYLSTPTGTIQEIKQVASQGDYEAFKDCCFEEELVFKNIRQGLESTLEPEELVFSKNIIDNEINVGKLSFKTDFENSKVFNEINTDNLKKTKNGFTIEAKNKSGGTNLIIFEDMNKGRIISFPKHKVVRIEAIN